MNYNKEFLVPYLEGIVALYMADKKIMEERGKSINNIRLVKNGYYSAIKPEEPFYRKTLTPLRMLGFAMSFFLCVLFFKAFLSDMSKGWIDADYVLMMVKTIVFLIIPPSAIAFYLIKKDEKYNLELEKKYNEKIKNWEKTKKLNEEVREINLPRLQNEISMYDSEHKEILQVLSQVYSVNIIPSQYRNLYAAVYLYDYFRTSQSTDLERALTLFVLEEIKSRLDMIIQQQSEMILNQQMMIAEQRKTRELQERYANQMIAKLDSIAASNEERNTYLDMIEANTRATAYFAAAEYLK